MAFTHTFSGKCIDGLLTPPGLRLDYQRSSLRHASTRRYSTVVAAAKVKAATVDAPSKTPVDGKSKSSSSSSSAKITPEEATDIYKDMKLGRDFEEM